MKKLTTKDWAKQHGIAVSNTIAAVKDYDKKLRRSAIQIATRALILHGIVAVSAGCDSEPVIEWFRSNNVWRSVTPNERKFLTGKSSDAERQRLFWLKEAEWALLWIIGKVPTLGLPTKQCNSQKLIDEIMPQLGDDTSKFIASAKLRTPGEFIAEADRSYNLWCYWNLDKKAQKPIPDDLIPIVLYERRRAFEWMDGFPAWDDVTCDA